MLPDELIGVEVRRVGWQEMQFQLPLGALDVFLHDASPVAGMAIDHQIDISTASLAELLEKFDKAACVEHPRIGLAPESTLRIKGTDRIDLLSLPGGLDHGRLPLESIGSSQVRLRRKTSLI